MFLGLGFLWIIDGRIKKEQAFHAFIATLIAWGVAYMIKTLFPTPRPYLVLGATPLTMTFPKDGSFPSEHTAAAWALALTVWQHSRKIGFWFLLGAVLVSIGRILSLVHYPIDILGGILIGVATSYFFEKMHLFRILSGKRY